MRKGAAAQHCSVALSDTHLTYCSAVQVGRIVRLVRPGCLRQESSNTPIACTGLVEQPFRMSQTIRTSNRELRLSPTFRSAMLTVRGHSKLLQSHPDGCLLHRIAQRSPWTHRKTPHGTAAHTRLAVKDRDAGQTRVVRPRFDGFAQRLPRDRIHERRLPTDLLSGHTLGQHRICNLHKTRDVCAINVIDSTIRTLSILDAGTVDTLHDLQQS